MDIIQIILLAIVTFIFAIDQFSLTELIYRPIIACPIIGLILGDMEIGLVVGGTYELMLVGNMPVGGAQPPNAVLGGIVAMVFTIKSGMDIDAALGAAVIFAVFGQYAVTLTFTVMSGLMAKADKAAADANPKGITAVNLTSMCIIGAFFAALAIAAYVGGDAIQKPLEEFSKNFSWVMAGLGAAGTMMKYVGFAILLKIMLSNDLWGIFLAGFAGSTIIGSIPALRTPGEIDVVLLLMALIGIAIAMYDFQTQTAIKNNMGSANGGMSDGI